MSHLRVHAVMSFTKHSFTRINYFIEQSLLKRIYARYFALFSIFSYYQFCTMDGLAMSLWSTHPNKCMWADI